MVKTDFKTIDEYISTVPEERQERLEKIRQIVAGYGTNCIFKNAGESERQGTN